MSSSVPKIEEIVLDKRNAGLGFNIRGGVDNIHIGSDPGIFVTTVKPSGAAAKDGRLQPGDKILEIDGNDLREVEHAQAVSHFHATGEMVTLLVERGAEQRILEQLKAKEKGVSIGNTANSSTPVQRRVHVPMSGPVVRLSLYKRIAWWSLILFGIGGGSILVILLLRRVRR